MLTRKIVETLLKLNKWKTLNITQKMALESGLLDSNENFVIIAPTASGKTGVAQLAALQVLESGGRVLYLVPMNPLISAKEEDFGVISQDISGMDSSPRDWDQSNVVITTFESFYRWALISPHHVKGFSLAIVDEFHVLYDPLRGFNLEKVITLLMELGIRIICLSATFEDKKEIGEWLNARVVVAPEKARKVEIKHGIIDLSGEYLSKQNRALCKNMLGMALEPYLVFCTTKESTKSRAKEMCSLLNKVILGEEELVKVFSEIVSRNSFTNLEKDLIACLSKGVAFHHSGLDRRLKDFIERLFLEREITYLFATTGLAYGVNLPAKSVILADTSFYDPTIPGKRKAVPTYMYTQMAGRAGRPTLEKDGYAFVVKKKTNDNVERYRMGRLERAFSHIGRDDYCRKAVLELIYSGRVRDEAILKFFERSFYNFQTERMKTLFVKESLFETIRRQVKFLYETGFVETMGASGYRLTGLGQVTIGFLFRTFASYDLNPFIELNKILEKEQKVRMDYNIIHMISSLFGGACLSKVPRQKSEEIITFYEKIGVSASDLGSAEYSAYAVFFAWMENRELFEIEEDYKVYTSQLPQIGAELSKLLIVYEKLARKKNLSIPKGFRDFRDRVRYGVTGEELPFRRLRGIGRESTRKIKVHCDTILRKHPFNYKGSILDIFEDIYKKQGKNRFAETLRYIKGIGKGRSGKILDLIESRA